MYNILEAIRRLVIKVNAQGKRRRKILCGKGRELKGNSCKPQSGKEKQRFRMAARKRKRTMRRRGAGQRMKTLRLRRRAMAKRKSMHIHNPGQQPRSHKG